MRGKDNQGFSPDHRDSKELEDNNFHNIPLENFSERLNEDKDEEKPSALQKIYTKHHKLIKTLLKLTIHVLVIGYAVYATYFFIDSENKGYQWEVYPNTSNVNITDGRCHGTCGFQFCDGYGMFLLIIGFTYFGFIYYGLFKPILGENIYLSFKKASNSLNRKLSERIIGKCTIQNIIAIIAGLLILIAILIFLYIETQEKQSRLIALIAPCVFIAGGYIFSKDRKAIKWRPVLVGILTQFLLGIICIRWEVGRNIFQCIGDKVVTFLNYSRPGSIFVYGELLNQLNVFAFALLPVIFFFSFCISILYYLGWMQVVILKLGWILSSLLGTTICESLNAGANIFLGMSESPLLIAPYIKSLTKSEMHAIMASGFATVSGTVLAAYVSYGASASLLITSSVMAAPAALAVSKLYYPETRESKTKSTNIELEKSQDASILDAASNGAANAIPIILGISANIVAFVAFVAFLNGIINWLGYLVGLDDINFEWFLSKIFMPLCFIMGIEWSECEKVGKVIATKTVLNEFVAYQKLGELIKAGELTARASGIAQFAICGFANPSSLGIMIGSLGTMAPEKRSEITAVAFRAFIVGCIVCFMSASFAGLMMSDEFLEQQTSTTYMPSVTTPKTKF